MILFWNDKLAGITIWQIYLS